MDKGVDQWVDLEVEIKKRCDMIEDPSYEFGEQLTVTDLWGTVIILAVVILVSTLLIIGSI